MKWSYGNEGHERLYKPKRNVRLVLQERKIILSNQVDIDLNTDKDNIIQQYES